METFTMGIETEVLIRVLLLGFLGFLLSMLITPLYTTMAYSGRWWKKTGLNSQGKEVAEISEAQVERQKRLIPTMAGGIAVVAVAIVTILFNLERTQTWLPLAAFVGAAGVGLLDDVLHLRGFRSALTERIHLFAKIKLGLITVVAAIGGWFFYYKLGVDAIHVPIVDTELMVGWLIIPIFMAVVVVMANAVNISDGLDGLAGGLAATAFAAYAIIAALEHQFGIAGFCMTIVGTLLSYTWFNIHPARFFMGDVGSFSLGTALGVVAMLTDTVLLLPLIGIVFFADAGSSLLQSISKRLRRGRAIFITTPLHYHLEASGWPETKVTMRLWVLGQVAGVLGIIIYLRGDYL